MNDAISDTASALLVDEGYRQFPYRDTVGKWTIGIGFNLSDVGLSKPECYLILQYRLRGLYNELEKLIPTLASLSVGRQSVLLNMCYNLGIEGLSEFKSMLAAVGRGDFHTASLEMKKSTWYSQIGARAERLSNEMLNG